MCFSLSVAEIRSFSCGIEQYYRQIWSFREVETYRVEGHKDQRLEVTGGGRTKVKGLKEDICKSF